MLALPVPVLQQNVLGPELAQKEPQVVLELEPVVLTLVLPEWLAWE